MNPLNLDLASLIVLGVVAHLAGDFLLQNDWMAVRKVERLVLAGPSSRWFLRHPAAYTHSGIHLVLLVPVFGLVALPVALVHLIIDTRVPVQWWMRTLGQTMPQGAQVLEWDEGDDPFCSVPHAVPVVDVGLFVQMAVDQTMHVLVIVLAAILISL